MSYVTLENFKYGLDARRGQLTEQPGTLLVLTNGHINPGGEIEKRPAFIRIPTSSAGGHISAGNLGLEIPNSAGPIYFQTPTGVSETPFVGYQLFTEFGSEVISSVVFSCAFGGKVFAIVQYTSTPNTFYALYWFGFASALPIPASYFGTITTSGLTITNIRDSIVIALQAALAAAGFSIAAFSTNAIDIKAQINQSFTLAIQVVSASGQISDTHMSDGQSGTLGNSAFCTIVINPGATSGTFDQIAAPNGVGGYVNLLAAGVPWQGSNTATALYLANAINSNVTSPKYTARQRSNSSVDIVAPIGSVYNGTNNVFVNYNGAGGDMEFNTLTNPLTAYISPAVLGGLRHSNVAATVYTRIPPDSTGPLGYAVCYVTGGKPPYTITWKIATASDPSFAFTTPVEANNVQNSPGATSGVAFYAFVPYNSTIGGSAYCTVVDSSTPPVTAITNTVGANLSNSPIITGNLP